MNLSDRSLALFSLCSHLGFGDEPDAKPLSARELNDLEQKLASASFAMSDLFGLTARKIANMVPISPAEAKRLAHLLNRSSELEPELARLQSLGIWVITRFDVDFPIRLNERSRGAASVMLYGAGDPRLLSKRGVAVVGSRSVNAHGLAMAELIGAACARSNFTVYSGNARGVDKTAMNAVIAAGGCAAGLLADSLERAVSVSDVRAALERGQLVLATPYSPYATFSVGMAMARNKMIYALADFALVIACEAGKGGTWAGAEYELRTGRVPIFAVDSPEAPDGNRRLIELGAHPYPGSIDDQPASLRAWLEAHATSRTPNSQVSLF